jgi:crossover junction endodeoxyribonuclease RuvC
MESHLDVGSTLAGGFFCRHMKSIGIDPGLAMTGFGVVESLSRGGRACDWGTIRTKADSPMPLRLKTIYDELNLLLEKWKPGVLVMEEVFVLKQFTKAAIRLGEVRGVVYLAAQALEIPVMQIRPTEVKSALTGSGRADKEQIQKTIRRILRIEEALDSSHAGDALALALTGLSRTENFRW